MMPYMRSRSARRCEICDGRWAVRKRRKDSEEMKKRGVKKKIVRWRKRQ